MTNIRTNQPALKKSVRLWPGVAAAIQLILFGYVAPVVDSEWAIVGLLGGLGCAFVIFVWWLFFSRVPWLERSAVVVLIVVALLATSRVVHVSIAEGAQGMLFPFLAVPGVALALVVSAVVGSRLASGSRFAWMAVLIVLASGVWTLVRTGGFTGGFVQDFHWRWTPTPEELLLASVGNEPGRLAPPAIDAAATAAVSTPAGWPGFRGPQRDGVIRGVQIETDWSRSPPVELWRRAIGPGWSSFAVHGDRVYTQEQRGEEEVVSCYRLTTGEPVWMHADPARFWETAGGAGPRGTPTLSQGRVFTMGATGILNALDAMSGSLVWSRNAGSDAGAKLPGWGFAGSPLVLGDTVVVAASGKLVAYDFASGDVRWTGPLDLGSGYSSPHFLTIAGIPQVLLMTSAGAISVSPTDGALLWKNESPTGSRIIQPTRISPHDVLMSNGDEGMGGAGVRRIAIRYHDDQWGAEEVWSSRGLKPNFNDLVIHKGQAFGFDGRIMACIDVADGKRKWKGGRYGNGQLLLLPEQDLLLVLAEDGRVALVSATPDKFTEFASIQALEGKTWNHPVLVGNVLLVRNSEQMAAYRLSLK